MLRRGGAPPWRQMKHSAHDCCLPAIRNFWAQLDQKKDTTQMVNRAQQGLLRTIFLRELLVKHACCFFSYLVRKGQYWNRFPHTLQVTAWAPERQPVLSLKIMFVKFGWSEKFKADISFLQMVLLGHISPSFGTSKRLQLANCVPHSYERGRD